MAKLLNIVSHSAEETAVLAEKLLNYFTPQDVVVLSGKLGAGKTVFVRGLAKGLGIDEKLINSPSFTLVNEYPGEKALFHFDLYRLNDTSELVEIGWDEYLGREGLVVVEWGEKAVDYLPRRYFRVEFEIIDEEQREINITLVEND